MSREPIPFGDLNQRELDREQRLLEIRREAEQKGEVKLNGIRPPGAPFPKASPETGYYGIPLLKKSRSGRARFRCTFSWAELPGQQL